MKHFSTLFILFGMVLLWSIVSPAQDGAATAASGDRAARPGRYQAMTVYGKPAVLDTQTGRLVIVNADYSTTVIDISKQTNSGDSKTVPPKSTSSGTAPKTTQPNPHPAKTLSEIPAKLTDELRRLSLRTIAKYGMKIGTTLIINAREHGVVAILEMRNNSSRKIRAIELTFRGLNAGGNQEEQRIYIHPGSKYDDLLLAPGGFKGVELQLDKVTTSDLKMEITFLLLEDSQNADIEKK